MKNVSCLRQKLISSVQLENEAAYCIWDQPTNTGINHHSPNKQTDLI